MKKILITLCLTMLQFGTIYTKELRNKADLIIFSYDRPLQLYALLESLSAYVTDMNTVILIYRTSNSRYEAAFNEVALKFPHVHFWKQKDNTDFKELTLKAIEESSSDYVLFAVDDNIVKDTVSLHECISWLERTKAYGFYLKLGTHLNYCYTENKPQAVPPYKRVFRSILSWAFESGERDWNYPNTVDMTLYRKKDLLDVFQTLTYSNPNSLEGNWAGWWLQHKSPNTIGLFYNNSKIINIPLNKVQTLNILNRDMNLYTPQELLEKFEAGYKMDIGPLYHIKNKAVHTEYEPTFVVRT